MEGRERENAKYANKVSKGVRWTPAARRPAWLLEGVHCRPKRRDTDG